MAKLKTSPPLPHAYGQELLAQVRVAVRQTARFVIQLNLPVESTDWLRLIPRSIKDPGWKCLKVNVRRAAVVEAMVAEKILNSDTGDLNAEQIRVLGDGQ